MFQSIYNCLAYLSLRLSLTVIYKICLFSTFSVLLFKLTCTSFRNIFTLAMFTILLSSFDVLAPKAVKLCCFRNHFAIDGPDDGYSRNMYCELNCDSNNDDIKEGNTHCI